jgi:hypothetical protein
MILSTWVSKLPLGWQANTWRCSCCLAAALASSGVCSTSSWSRFDESFFAVIYGQIVKSVKYKYIHI